MGKNKRSSSAEKIRLVQDGMVRKNGTACVTDRIAVIIH
jgi:hypothetical protein